MASEICWYDRTNKSRFSYGSLRLQQYVTIAVCVRWGYHWTIIKSKWVLISQAFPFRLNISIDILVSSYSLPSLEHHNSQEQENEYKKRIFQLLRHNNES